MKDMRDPEEYGLAIQAIQKRLGCSILEAADALDQAVGLGLTSSPALKLPAEGAQPPPDTAPQERGNGFRPIHP